MSVSVLPPAIPSSRFLTLCRSLSTLLDDSSDRIDVSKALQEKNLKAEALTDKISYAFQLSSLQGPLCNEPMQGVAVIIEDITIAETQEDEVVAPDAAGKLSSEVIRATRESIRLGFLDWSPRLLLAMYSCEIQTSSKSP